ncbi:MAG: glycosyltransferase [Myxococcota bacterium]
MRRLLVIAYFFPPLGGGGVQRTAAFVRHWPDFGWFPVVLTGRLQDYWAWDQTLAEGLSAEVHRVEGRVERLQPLLRRMARGSFRRMYEWAWFPDERIGWKGAAVRAAKRLHKAQRFDAIYSTGAPWTNHLVARALKRSWGCRWVADFRDPWTENPSERRPPWLQALHHRQEATVHAEADAILANTSGQADRLRSRFEPQGRIEVVPNGYEEQDFEGLADVPARSGSLGYAGSFYRDYRPDALFRALAALERPPKTLELVGNVGRGEGWPATLPVQAHGVCTHRRSLEILAGCAGLFAVLPERPGTERWIPQKLYVYLRLGKPVLWMGPDGEAWRLLHRASPVHLRLSSVRPDLGRLQAWLDQLPPRADNDAEWVKRFDRRIHARQVADLLKDLVG